MTPFICNDYDCTQSELQNYIIQEIASIIKKYSIPASVKSKHAHPPGAFSGKARPGGWAFELKPLHGGGAFEIKDLEVLITNNFIIIIYKTKQYQFQKI
jgi:hypothetical protein